MDYVRRRTPWTAILQHTQLSATHTIQNIHVHFDRKWHLRFAQLVYRHAAAGSAVNRRPIHAYHWGFTFRNSSVWFERFAALRDQFRHLIVSAAGFHSRLMHHADFEHSILSRFTWERTFGAFRGVPFALRVLPHAGPAVLGTNPAASTFFHTLDRRSGSSVLVRLTERFMGIGDKAVHEGQPMRTMRFAHTLHSRVEHAATFRLASFVTGSHDTSRESVTPGPELLANGRSGPGQVFALHAAIHRQELTLQHLAVAREERAHPVPPVSLTFVKRESNHTESITRALAEIQQSLNVTHSRETAPAAVDIPYLTRQVYDQFERELRIERERRGM
jgi:hypothetical protein